MPITRRLSATARVAALALVAITPIALAADSLSGSIRSAGSSTAGPVTEAVAEAFNDIEPDVRISVVKNGTGGGFKRFVAGETDISNASRLIKPEEIEAAQDNGIEFIELPIAFDGITVCVNKDNTWANELTVDQLKRIFREGSDVSSWNDLNPEWPDIDIAIHMPGTDSGTFDYFKENILGDDLNARSTAGDVKVSVSEDDNLLINGIAGDRGAIGFFGCSYYFQNRELIRSVAVKASDEAPAVRPTPETIESGEYKPLSRPLFIYVNAQSAKRPEVEAFIEFYFREGPDLAERVGYVRLPSAVNFLARQRFARGYTGSVFYKENDEGELVHTSGPLRELLRSDHRERMTEPNRR